MTDTSGASTGTPHAFQADVARLLHLMVHSIYSDRDIYIRELVSNAADACEKLRYESLTQPGLISDEGGFAIKITVDEANHQITISDNGIGISAADLPRVFDKGFTGENGRRYSKSTGIGLYLSQRLCRKMNISLSISSVPGQGTTVTMVFPTESYLQAAGL